MIAAALWSARKLSANNQFERPAATERIWFLIQLLSAGGRPSSTLRVSATQHSKLQSMARAVAELSGTCWRCAISQACNASASGCNCTSHPPPKRYARSVQRGMANPVRPKVVAPRCILMRMSGGDV